MAIPVKFAAAAGFPIKLPRITGELLLGRFGLDLDSGSLACDPTSSDCRFLRLEFLPDATCS